MRFERLLDACEAFAAESGWAVSWRASTRGASTRTAACSLAAFARSRIGVSMRLRPEGPHFDTPAHYVIDDLR